MSVLNHSGHDYALLVERWQSVAVEHSLHSQVLCTTENHPVFVFENEASKAGQSGGLYISTGIHGDECAPVWALLDWVAANPPFLSTHPVVILPCLNPVGLIANHREAAHGIDLNRQFNDPSHPLIAALHHFLQERRFDCTVTLHEDYDSTGIYLYELSLRGSHGDALLTACESTIPRETATEVDGNPFTRALLFRDYGVDRFIEEQLGGGWPESIYLFQHHSDHCYTFETPSEFDLTRRIITHRLFLDALAYQISTGN